MNTLKSLVLALIVANLLMLSCNKDDNANNTAPVVRNNVIAAENETLKTAIEGLNGTTISTYLTGIITNEGGEALEGVSVSYDQTTVTTDNLGRFTFGEITLDSKFNLIKATKDNYLEGYKTITPTADAYNTVSMQLLSQGTPQIVNASTGGSLTIDEVVTLTFNTDSFITTAGEAYTGNVNVVGRYIAPDASNFAQIIPGTLVGLTDSGTFDALISYGMLTVELQDDNGNILEIAGDRTVTVEMPLKGNTEASIPLWHFNETHGLWIEAGVANKVGDVFMAEVTHFSTWNLDVNEPGYDVEVTITDENNNPLANQDVIVKNDNGNVLAQVYTDNNGEFTLLRAPQNLVFTLQLLCEESSSSAVTDISSGTVTVAINTNSGSARSYTLQGTISDCDDSNNAITHNNKYFSLTSADGSINYGGQTASDGTYSLTSLLCDVDSTTPFTLEAVVNTDTNLTKTISETLTFSGDSQVLNLDYCEPDTQICTFPNDCFVIPFEDANFEQAVREVINKPTGVITYGDIYHIPSLDLSNSSISNISGIESFTSLEILYLSFNQISNISFLEGLTNLTDLDLNENQITDISPLANLTSLISLYIGSNQISDISFLSGLSNLLELVLIDNQISDISPIANLTNLGSLHLSVNQITDISTLANLTNLGDLKLAGNQITDISSLANLTGIHELDLSYNQIIDVSPLQNFSFDAGSILLNNNQISDVSSLCGLPSSYTGDINLSGNNLTTTDINDLQACLPNANITN